LKDTWRHPGDTERHRETLEALEPFLKCVPDVVAGVLQMLWVLWLLLAGEEREMGSGR